MNCFLTIFILSVTASCEAGAIPNSLSQHQSKSIIWQPFDDGTSSPKGTFRVVYERGDTRHGPTERIVLISKKRREVLPIQDPDSSFPRGVERAKTEPGNTPVLANAGECHISPDEQWICLEIKLSHGCARSDCFRQLNG